MKEIPNYDGYKISENGEIFSMKTGKILKDFEHNRFGYRAVNLYVGEREGKKTKFQQRYVNHLVLETYVGERPDGFVCAHLDGNPRNNSLSNLKWVSQKENLGHRVLHGTFPYKKSKPKVFLTEEQKKWIIDNSEIYLVKYMAKTLNLSEQRIRHVIKQKTSIGNP